MSTLTRNRRWILFALLAFAVFAAVDFFAVRSLLQSQAPTVESKSTADPEADSPLTPAPDKPRTASDELEKVTTGGELADDDYRQIRQLIAKREHLLDRNIIGIEVLGPNKIDVTTGPEYLKPLDGGGDIITMERRDGSWTITKTAYWVG